jgi:hypothetical protein
MDEFGRRHSSYLPASVLESRRFYSAFNKICAFGIAFNAISSTVLFHVIINYKSMIDPIVMHFPYLSGRISGLAAYDGISQYSYISVIVSTLVTAPIVVILSCYYYWKFVIKTGSYDSLRSRSAVGMFFFVVLSAFSIWIIFIYRGEFGIYPGMKRILLWPFFPVFGSMVGIFVFASSFVIFGGICKLVMRRGRDEH